MTKVYFLFKKRREEKSIRLNIVPQEIYAAYSNIKTNGGRFEIFPNSLRNRSRTDLFWKKKI